MALKIDYKAYLASREWRLKRREVIERAKNLCERCSHAPTQSVHHLTYKRIGNEELYDLLGVCRPCHEYLSAERDDDPAVAIIKRLLASGDVVGDWIENFDGIPWLHFMGEETAHGVLHLDISTTEDYNRMKLSDPSLAAQPVIGLVPGVVATCVWY